MSADETAPGFVSFPTILHTHYHASRACAQAAGFFFRLLRGGLPASHKASSLRRVLRSETAPGRSSLFAMSLITSRDMHFAITLHARRRPPAAKLRDHSQLRATPSGRITPFRHTQRAEDADMPIFALAHSAARSTIAEATAVFDDFSSHERRRVHIRALFSKAWALFRLLPSHFLEFPFERPWHFFYSILAPVSMIDVGSMPRVLSHRHSAAS